MKPDCRSVGRRRPLTMSPFWLAALLSFCGTTHAAVSTVDDAGTTIQLLAPARRIISLAPHTTELLFAAGAGQYIVGVSEYSDFPAEARHIASVGNSTQLDLERIVGLKPDLVVAWQSGNSARQLARLKALGVAVFASEPRQFEAIASSIERLAVLSGTPQQGAQAASAFRQQLQHLRTRYAQRPTVSVFYQIWPSPLMTLSQSHLVSQALSLCGGDNIFAKLPQLVPTVSLEAVVKANPEVIFFSDEKSTAKAMWQRFPTLTAVRQHNLLAINGTLMNRASPRILNGAADLCEQLEQARLRRPHPVLK